MDELLRLLRASPHAPHIRSLVEELELQLPVDLSRDAGLLRGVWELRWSSASQPWLRQAPWLENLQVLDPERQRGMNLLRLPGPLGALAAVAVQARLEPAGGSRIHVTFERGGWIGPRLGGLRPELLARLRQSFPAWLDITVLTPELRVCRGNADTIFALLRRRDLTVESLLADWHPQPPPSGKSAAA
jgi:hypothetical protein